MLRILILLLMMYHQVLSWESLYSELKNLGGSCFPRDSCYPSRSEEDDHLWNNYTCECGSHCLQYSTCCADSPYINEIRDVKLQAEKCQKISGVSNAVKLVSQCSNRWFYGTQVQIKCENSNTETDPIAGIPVTSLKTHITYKNYFCARCNCDVQDILFWKLSLQVKHLNTFPSRLNLTEEYIINNMAYNGLEQSWVIMINGTFYSIDIQPKLTPSLQKFVKKCYPNMISGCDSSYEHSMEVQQKCLSYYAPIELAVNSRLRKYRNIHCALCNNVNISQNETDICSLEIVNPKRKPSFSFALLLDINRKDGELVGKVKLCEEDQTWDPFFKKCRSMRCALPGYVVKNGKCVKN